jgi:hypothetical protein
MNLNNKYITYNTIIVENEVINTFIKWSYI